MALDWKVVSVAVGFIALTIAVLLDMLARAFSLKELSMFVKAEYAQIAVTFLIIGLAFTLQTTGDSISKTVVQSIASATGGPLDDQINSYTGTEWENVTSSMVGRAYLRDTVIENCQKPWYMSMLDIETIVEPLSSFQFEIINFEAIAGGYAFGGLASAARYIANGIVQLAVFEYAQYYLLTIAQYTMIPIFLPLGLLLRSFPLTRGAGGLMVAIALGFGYVFPMTYLLSIAMMPSLGYACNAVNLNLAEESPCFQNQGEIGSYILEVRAKTGSINQTIDDARDEISILYLQAFIYPLVSLIVTFTFIRQTGSLFGADLAEIGRGLIKII
jgi:hypothetical protein